MEYTSTFRNASALLVLTCFALAPAGAQSIPGFTAPAGYIATLTDLPTSGIAISPSGLLAVSNSNSSGGGTLSIYDRVEGTRTLLKTFSAPAGDTFRFFGGLTFADDNTLYFGENGAAKTVFRADLTGGSVTKLAPNGSVPSVAGVAFRSGSVYALSAGDPGSGAVYQLTGGLASVFASNLGSGYLGGIDFAMDGSLYVGDTNDPDFVGNAGNLLKIGASGTVVQTISLSGGGGSGLYDFAFDSEGDIFASTGKTLTEVHLGATPLVSNFGTFSGSFPFPTSVTFRGGGFSPYSGTGSLYVGGEFTGVGGVFRIQPTAVPEPSSVFGLAFASGGAFSLLRLRRVRLNRKRA